MPQQKVPDIEFGQFVIAEIPELFQKKIV